MTPERSFQWTAWSFAAAIVAGIASLIWAQGRSIFRVPDVVADEAYFAWCGAGGRIDAAAGDRYLAMFGDHYLWADLGAGLFATGLTGLILTVSAKNKAADEHWALTPNSRWHFIFAGWTVIAWTWFVSSYSLYEDLGRQIFPMCADSIGIPLSGLFALSIVLLIVCTLVGLLLLKGFGQLPAPLGLWDKTRPIRAWIVTSVFSALIMFIAWLMIESSRVSSSIGNPVGLIAIYLLASTRAALLSPRIDVE